MKNLLARLALLGSIAAFVAVASSAFAQDKPPAPASKRRLPQQHLQRLQQRRPPRRNAATRGSTATKAMLPGC